MFRRSENPLNQGEIQKTRGLAVSPRLECGTIPLQLSTEVLTRSVSDLYCITLGNLVVLCSQKVSLLMLNLARTPNLQSA